MDLKAYVQSDIRSRPRRHAFYPPGDSALCHALVRLFLPLSLRLQLKVTGVGIPPDDLGRLRALRGRRCLLLPSHCGGFEPHVLLHLAGLLRQRFHYLAALELFERTPLNAWFLRGIGAYSIVRGTADRPSFLMSKQLLVAGERWLVIFPEGHSDYQNDAMVPFQQGVIQLAFRAFEEAMEQSSDASLYCVPLAIKYVYGRDMRETIEAGLARLEAAVFASPPPPAAPYDRLRRVGEAVLTANERKHDVSPAPGASFDCRIQYMKETVVRRIEAQLGIAPRPEQNLLDRIRALFNSVDQIVQAEPRVSNYERRILAERQRAASVLYDDLWRMLQFAAMYDGYVREDFTSERFLDALGMLESEVFGRHSFYGPRRALVAVGQPIDLRDRWAAYRTDRRAEVRAVTLDLETAVRSMLAALARSAGSPAPGAPPRPSGPRAL